MHASIKCISFTGSSELDGYVTTDLKEMELYWTPRNKIIILISYSKAAHSECVIQFIYLHFKITFSF